jgi:site-specific DNA recombinase
VLVQTLIVLCHSFKIVTVKAIATYQRVSTEEQSRNSDAFTRQGWQLDREAAKYPHQDRISFSDIQSGRKDDRPDFLRLIAAIESGKIDTLIITRIDRIGRDLESNSKLQKQLQRKGVRVYEILLGRFLDWLNPHDWGYFVQAGLDGEKESRMLSARIKQTFEWHRSQGKLGGGMVGFPYRRNKDGKIEPHPEHWEIAIKCIKLVVKYQGATMPAISEIRALGLNRTRIWLSNWMRSPLIRGHIPINTFDSNRKKKPLCEWDFFRDSHLSLFSDPRLVGMEAEIDRIIQDSRRYKGKARTSIIHPLSGLIYCARCNSNCHIKTSVDPRYPSVRRVYAVCSQRSSKGINCGGEYGVFDGKRKSVNTPYSDIESQVILAFSQKAAEIIDLEIAQVPNTKPEDPAIEKLRSEIKRLASFDDSDLLSAISKKTEQLNKLLLADPTEDFSIKMRTEFVETFASGEVLSQATDIQKRSLYRDWVRRIDVDQQKITVALTI